MIMMGLLKGLRSRLRGVNALSKVLYNNQKHQQQLSNKKPFLNFNKCKKNTTEDPKRNNHKAPKKSKPNPTHPMVNLKKKIKWDNNKEFPNHKSQTYILLNQLIYLYNTFQKEIKQELKTAIKEAQMQFETYKIKNQKL